MFASHYVRVLAYCARALLSGKSQRSESVLEVSAQYIWNFMTPCSCIVCESDPAFDRL